MSDAIPGAFLTPGSKTMHGILKSASTATRSRGLTATSWWPTCSSLKTTASSLFTAVPTVPFWVYPAAISYWVSERAQSLCDQVSGISVSDRLTVESEARKNGRMFGYEAALTDQRLANQSFWRSLADESPSAGNPHIGNVASAVSSYMDDKRFPDLGLSRYWDKDTRLKHVYRTAAAKGVVLGYDETEAMVKKSGVHSGATRYPISTPLNPLRNRLF